MKEVNLAPVIRSNHLRLTAIAVKASTNALVRYWLQCCTGPYTVHGQPAVTGLAFMEHTRRAHCESIKKHITLYVL